jgi:hypothetical protein
LVAARQVEAAGLGVEQALVPAQQPLERELIASLRGLDEPGVFPRAGSGRPPGVSCLAAFGRSSEGDELVVDGAPLLPPARALAPGERGDALAGGPLRRSGQATACAGARR